MEKVKFNNGKLRILQISDAQDLHWVRKTMLLMLENACEQLKPDLIVFTGDNILGNHLRDYRFSSKKKEMSRDEEFEIMRTALAHILDIPERRGIPFAMIYGNHDDMNSFTGDEQAEIFRSYSMNRGFENTGDLCGTYRLPVYSSDGEKQLLNLWMINTSWHDKALDRCFNDITETQVEWFKKESAEQKELNGGNPFDSLVFMHIPLKELCNFTVECSPEEATVSYNDINLKKADGVFGYLNEPVTPIENDNGFYEEVLSDGGVRAIVSGHDHTNDFVGEKDGIKFVSSPAASFRCYGGANRGVKLFEIDENNTSDFYCRTVYYNELCGDGPIAKLRWFWDADECEKKKFAVLGGIAISTAVIGGAAAVCKLLKK
ncbi:MAG: metallophosphoesterase [Clostridia bacterium]|nr:metallophosphoesterase [Clostridia bacterium]